MEQFHGTTILSVRRQDAQGRWQVALADLAATFLFPRLAETAR